MMLWKPVVYHIQCQRCMHLTHAFAECYHFNSNTLLWSPATCFYLQLNPLHMLDLARPKSWKCLQCTTLPAHQTSFDFCATMSMCLCSHVASVHATLFFFGFWRYTYTQVADLRREGKIFEQHVPCTLALSLPEKWILVAEQNGPWWWILAMQLTCIHMPELNDHATYGPYAIRSVHPYGDFFLITYSSFPIINVSSRFMAFQRAIESIRQRIVR